jgi:hypothetical protein
MSDARTYVIEKRGEQWCLLTHDKSRVLGCHDSEAGALAQERAVEAAKHSEELRSIHGVEIFKSGTWNGDKYDENDLDAMVSAFNEMGFTPPIKAGHSDESSAPALGWVENLRRVGSSLVADLTALPQKVFEAIRRRSYDRVSAEIYWGLKRNGKEYPRVLKALALLGAEIPAVDLQPLSAFLALAQMPSLPPGTFAAYAVDLTTDLVITRELMQTLCEPCAAEMAERKITRLRIPLDENGSYDFAAAFKSYAGFSEGLCEKFGDAEGFRTRCMEQLSPHVDDSAAFCNSLKQWCGLMSERGGTTKTQETEITMAQETELKPGQIIVDEEKVTELRQRAKIAEQLPELRERLRAAEEREVALVQKRREEIVRQAAAEVRVPAFRQYVRIFYDLALNSVDGGAKKYSLADPKKQMTAEDVVKQFIDDLNKQADHFFKTLSVDVKTHKEDLNEPDEYGAKVQFRVGKYQRANPTVDYKTALKAVLDADPDLKEAYSRT